MIEHYANIAEIVGVVLVIITLAFLTLEIRHNTLATQATLNMDVLDYGREIAQLLLSDDEMADIVLYGSQRTLQMPRL